MRQAQPTGKGPGRYRREKTSLIEFFDQFPNEQAAERWFAEALVSRSRAMPAGGRRSKPSPRFFTIDGTRLRGPPGRGAGVNTRCEHRRSLAGAVWPPSRELAAVGGPVLPLPLEDQVAHSRGGHGEAVDPTRAVANEAHFGEEPLVALEGVGTGR